MPRPGTSPILSQSRELYAWIENTDLLLLTMAYVHHSEDYQDLNYFVCTLGQANNGYPQPFKTINDFVDHQARQFPNRPAVAFPIPQENGGEQWGQTVYCESACLLMQDVFLGREHRANYYIFYTMRSEMLDLKLLT